MDKLLYAEARYIIQDGDIVFVKTETHSWLSRIISFWTRGPHTHVGIAFWMNLSGYTPRLMIIESQRFTKRRIINLSYYSDCELVIINSPRNWELYVEDAFAHLGKVGYSWLDAIHVGIQEYSNQWTTKIIPHVGGEFCSEFVARMVQHQEVFISPQRLYDDLSVIHHIKCITQGR